MKRNFLPILSEKNNGFTLIEVLVSLLILTFILFSSLFIFRENVRKMRIKASEKEIYKNAFDTFSTMENYLSKAKINSQKGKLRMDFKGEKNSLKFISMVQESEKSDFVKVGIFFRDNKIKMYIEKVNEKNGFGFRNGFPGAQVLAENISDFEILYSDKGKWKEKWDTSEKENHCLPDFVKIKMTVFYKKKIEGKIYEKTFERIIKVGYE